MANISCSLDQAGLTERRARWHRLAAQAFDARVPTDRGQRLVFRRQAGVEEELLELALLEQECCAFADWSVSAVDGTVVLDVSGTSDEAIAAVQGMFGSLQRA